MDLLKVNAFKGGIFKQLKFLVSAPPSAQKCLYISEAGTVSQELLPINTGFVSAENAKKAWLVLHPLKQPVKKYGVIVQDEAVLSISDRSYYPLDPQNTMKQKDRENLMQLNRIAKMKHAQARTDMGRDQDPQANLAHSIVNYSFIILGLVGLAAVVLKGCGG